MAKGVESQRLDPWNVHDGKIFQSKSKRAHVNSILRRNLTRRAKSKSDCFIDGRLLVGKDCFAV
jgi:hypothetical protein